MYEAHQAFRRHEGYHGGLDKHKFHHTIRDLGINVGEGEAHNLFYQITSGRHHIHEREFAEWYSYHKHPHHFNTYWGW